MAKTVYWKDRSGRRYKRTFSDNQMSAYKRFKKEKGRKVISGKDFRKFKRGEVQATKKELAQRKASEKYVRDNKGRVVRDPGMQREERESAAKTISRLESGGQLGRDEGQVGGLAPSQIADAQQVLGEQGAAQRRASAQMMQRSGVAEGKAANAAQLAQQHKDAIAKAKQQNWTLNNVPVKEVNGKLVYDTQKIGETMGLDQKQIDKALSVKWGDMGMTTEDKLGDMAGGTAAQRKSLSRSKSMGAIGSDQEAILNNLKALDPTVAQVDFSKADHVANLAKSGFMHTDIKDVRGRLDRGQGPRGMGQYAPAVISGLAGIVNPFLGAGMHTFMQGAEAAQGDISLADAAKSSAMAVGTAGLGYGADRLFQQANLAKNVAAGPLADLGGQGMVGAGTRGLAKGLITGTGGEALGMLQGEDFNLGDVAKSAAVGAGGAIAGEAIGDIGDKLGIGAPTEGDSLDSAIAAEFADVDAAELGLNVDAALQDAFGAVDAAELGMYEPAGAGAIGGIGTSDVGIKEEGLMTGPGVVGGTIGSNDPIVMGRPVDAESGYTNIYGESPELAAIRQQQTNNFSEPMQYADVPSAGTETMSGFGGAEFQAQADMAQTQPQYAKTPGLAEVGAGILGIAAPIVSDLMGDDDKGRGQVSRQGQMFGSTASTYDPESELQKMGVRSVELNPSLNIQGVEEVDEEEKKRRKALWQSNPLVSTMSSNDFGGPGSIM